jgi:hypothetical protein
MLGIKQNNSNFLGNKNSHSSFLGNKHIGRKISNTIEKINEYAMPGLAIASSFQPELTPIFGTIGAGLKTAGSIAKNFKNF